MCEMNVILTVCEQKKGQNPEPLAFWTRPAKALKTSLIDLFLKKSKMAMTSKEHALFCSELIPRIFTDFDKKMRTDYFDFV